MTRLRAAYLKQHFQPTGNVVSENAAKPTPGPSATDLEEKPEMTLKTKSPRLMLSATLVAIVAMFAFASSASAAVSGKTTLKLDPGTAGALTSLGVAVSPVSPATAGPNGVAFPITGAAIKLHPLAATIRHSGGLNLTKGATTVSLTDYTIYLGRSPRLVATVNGGPRVSILKLDLSRVGVSLYWRTLILSNVKATLTAQAAGALNAAFGTTALSEGLVLGTATVKARLF